MKNRQPIEVLPNYHHSQMAWQWRIFFVILFFGPAGYFGYEGDYVLAATMAAIGIGAFGGWRVGAMAMVASVTAIAAAVHFAPDLAYQHEWRFTEWFGTTGLLNRFVSIAAVGLGITFVTSLLIALISGRLFRSYPLLNRSNRWLGLMVGGAEGLVTVVLLLGGVLVLEPVQRERELAGAATTKSSSQISDLVFKTADLTRDSEIGPYIEKYNPFVVFPKLNKIEQVQKSVQVLSDPGKIEKLMHHPEVQQLQERPEVRTAVNKVMEDPEIQEVLHSGQPMNRSFAMKLLNHPAILELVDQPGFVAVATKAIQSTGVFGP